MRDVECQHCKVKFFVDEQIEHLPRLRFVFITDIWRVNNCVIIIIIIIIIISHKSARTVQSLDCVAANEKLNCRVWTLPEPSKPLATLLRDSSQHCWQFQCNIGHNCTVWSWKARTSTTSICLLYAGQELL